MSYQLAETTWWTDFENFDLAPILQAGNLKLEAEYGSTQTSASVVDADARTILAGVFSNIRVVLLEPTSGKRTVDYTDYNATARAYNLPLN